jgi:galactokinase
VTAVEEQLRAAGMSAVAAASRAAMFERASEGLRARGASAEHRYHVPGRIEVLGKHTDYAGGRSLLCAVERGFVVASAGRDDGVVRLMDVGRGDESVLSFDPEFATSHLPHWSIYSNAVVKRLARDFPGRLRGADVVFISDLPPSSGLSSSSALLIATYEALRAANELDARADFQRALPTAFDVAAYLGSIESGRPFGGFEGAAGVGVAAGNQDQTAILLSEPRRLIQVGYAPPRLEGAVDVPSDRTFVIAMSGVVAQKTGGAQASYNRAAAHSAALLEVWNRTTGRNDPTPFEALSSREGAIEDLRAALLRVGTEFPTGDLEARLRQFSDETFVLIPAAFEALRRGDLRAFGDAVARSQEGAERGLTNQVPETIHLARSARTLGGDAASAFGAGFGGSVWAMVGRGDAERFARDWERDYRDRFDHPATTFFGTEAGPPLTRLGV